MRHSPSRLTNAMPVTLRFAWVTVADASGLSTRRRRTVMVVASSPSCALTRFWQAVAARADHDDSIPQPAGIAQIAGGASNQDQLQVAEHGE